MPPFEQCNARESVPQTSNLNATEIYIINGKVMNPASLADSNCPCANRQTTAYDLAIGQSQFQPAPSLYRQDVGFQPPSSFYGQDMRANQSFYSFPATINVFRSQNGGLTLQIDLSAGTLDNLRWNPGSQLSDSVPIGRSQTYTSQFRQPLVDGGNGMVFDTQTGQWYRKVPQQSTMPQQRLPNSRDQQWYDPQTKQWYRIPPPQRTVQQPNSYELWLQQQEYQRQMQEAYQQRMQGNQGYQPQLRPSPRTQAPRGRAQYGVDPSIGVMLDRRNQQMRGEINSWEADVLGNPGARVRNGRQWEDPLDFDPDRTKVGESVGNYLKRYGPDRQPQRNGAPPPSTFEGALRSFGGWLQGR